MTMSCLGKNKGISGETDGGRRRSGCLGMSSSGGKGLCFDECEDDAVGVGAARGENDFGGQAWRFGVRGFGEGNDAGAGTKLGHGAEEAFGLVAEEISINDNAVQRRGRFNAGKSGHDVVGGFDGNAELFESFSDKGKMGGGTGGDQDGPMGNIRSKLLDGLFALVLGGGEIAEGQGDAIECASLGGAGDFESATRFFEHGADDGEYDTGLAGGFGDGIGRRRVGKRNDKEAGRSRG